MCDLNLVLNCLMKPLFEPLATCSILQLTMKMVFLVAITSTQRVGELGALIAEPSFTVFFGEKFHRNHILRFYLNYLLNCILTRLLIFHFFSSQSHTVPRRKLPLPTLDGRMVLVFYLERTKPFKKSYSMTFLFHFWMDPKNPVSTQRLMRWISGCTISC